jgi:hypothetical protein
MKKLTEGLQAHDLDYLVMPLISIDEYESKIDDRKAIVVGIYVTDIDPANELSGFIEKGVVPVLDTEVSPAPTEDGYYVVFIEIDRNDRFVKRLLNIIETVSNLTNVDNWEFSPYHSDKEENYPVTAEMLKKHVNLDPNSIEIRDTKEKDQEDQEDQIAEFLQHSAVGSIAIDEQTLTFNDSMLEQAYEIVGFSKNIDSLSFTMPELGDRQLAESARLQNMIGYGYTVNVAGEHLVVVNERGILTLKPPFAI